MTDVGATPLATLVGVSMEVSRRPSRRAKITLIADQLRVLSSDAAALAVSYLSGEIAQGRIGIGPAQIDSLQSAGSVSAPA